ncbi:MAG TPA: ribosome biogenesis GTP-binding protein YihA/YsxC [Terriglobales bacterium]|nr:ribosome biogenesis GTP-binding protein YihA/YsxC [Terriglobales bacterium]
MRILTKFLRACADPRQFPPPGPPEVAFLGRSNVGKSSLINSLVGSKIAKTSNTPGRTQTINFFEIRWPGRPKPDLIFADLPGYGYARAPKDLVQEWPSFINPYLEGRPTLTLCVCLVDGNIPPQQSDAQLIAWLRHVNRPFVVVVTKSDRAGSQLQKSLKALRQELGVEELLTFSSKTGLGRDTLWKKLREASDSLEPPEMLNSASG